MHKLLAKQIAKIFGSLTNLPAACLDLTSEVEKSYFEFERQLNKSETLLPPGFPDSHLVVDAEAMVEQCALDPKFFPNVQCSSLLKRSIENTLFWRIEGFPQAFKRAQARGRTATVEYSSHAAASLTHFELRLCPLTGSRVLVLIRDETRRKLEEDGLVQAKKLYRDIFENTLVGIYLTAPEGRFVNANPAMARILGFDTPQELVDTYIDLARQMYVDSEKRAELMNMLTTQPSVPDFECQLKRRDGRVIWASINARAIYDESGRLIFIEGTVEDTTNRKLADQARLRYREELEERVAERTAELTAANARLKREIDKRKIILKRYKVAKEAAESANRAKSEFLSIVSHELRTPLTSVLGFAKIIRKKLSSGLYASLCRDEKCRSDLDTVISNIDIVVSEGQRLTNLINDLLDIAKLEAGKSEIMDEPLDLADLTDKAWRNVAPLAEGKEIEFTSNIPKISGLRGDSEKLLQVLINLFSNAIKFTPQGTISCEARIDRSNVLVCVQDSGVGIALEKQESIFEKFIQASDTLTDKPKGTGLGLAICRKIINHHKGIIWVESYPGQGSSFKFTLPLANAEDEALDP